MWRSVLWRFGKPLHTYIVVVINVSLYENNRHYALFFFVVSWMFRKCWFLFCKKQWVIELKHLTLLHINYFFTDKKINMFHNFFITLNKYFSLLSIIRLKDIFLFHQSLLLLHFLRLALNTMNIFANLNLFKNQLNK